MELFLAVIGGIWLACAGAIVLVILASAMMPLPPGRRWGLRL